jgi:hypothetical protein
LTIAYINKSNCIYRYSNNNFYVDEPEDDTVKSPDKKTDKKTLKNPDKMTDKKMDKNPKALSPGNPTKDALASMRVCDGCKRGETPGEKLRNKIRQQIEHHAEKGLSMQQRREKRAQSTAENQETISALDKFGQFVAVKLGENIGIQFADTPPGQMIKLSRGSAYGEDNQQITTAHKPGCMGYIEILNKSDEFFCVKVLRKGGDQKFEVPRPSYIAVPPNLSVHGLFNKEEDEDVEENNLEIIILCNNPNPTGKNINSLKYDTFLYGDKSKISPCAKVEFFEKVIYYKINSQNSNVLLKYKKDGCLETRNGNSMKRVGIMGMINGSKVVDGKIDYATNISNIETVFSMSC